MADKGYPLPLVPDPEGYKCVLLHIPDEPYHIRAFWGHLLKLARWYSWAEDESHTGTLAAQRWNNVFHEAHDLFYSTAGDCGSIGGGGLIYDIRSDGCGIEIQRTEGGAWIPLADFSTCGAVGPEGPIGPIGPEGPPGDGGPDSEGGVPDPTPYPGVDLQCAVADGVASVVLDAFEEFCDQRIAAAELGFALLAVGGYLLGGFPGLLVDVMGAIWAQNTVTDFTNAKASLTASYKTDVMCALYCNIEEAASITRDVTLLWSVDVAALAGTYGTMLPDFIEGFYVSELRNQANLLAVTAGTCNSCPCYVEEWDWEFDFEAGQQGFGPWGFNPNDPQKNAGLYIATEGWRSVDTSTFGWGTTGGYVGIRRDFVATTITKIVVTWELIDWGGGTGEFNNVLWKNLHAWPPDLLSTDHVVGERTMTWEGEVVSTMILAGVASSYYTSANKGIAYIRSIHVWGQGDNPFD